jgi:hypothetical protein
MLNANRLEELIIRATNTASGDDWVPMSVAHLGYRIAELDPSSVGTSTTSLIESVVTSKLRSSSLIASRAMPSATNRRASCSSSKESLA